MPNSDFPLIFIPFDPASPSYTPKGAGGSSHGPVRDRVAHASKIFKALAIAVEGAQSSQSTARATRKGIYLEFEGADGYTLPRKSLENKPKGIRLLNVRPVHERGTERATVYIPKSSITHFFSKIDEYIEKENPKTETPKNASLIDSIENVRQTLLDAFWTDDIDKMPGSKQVWVEVWLSSDDDLTVSKARKTLSGLGIKELEQKPILRFPERTVILVEASDLDLLRLIQSSDQIAEFRASREPSNFFDMEPNEGQVEWVEDLLSRTEEAPSDSPVICILDSGVNRGHPLLKNHLASADLHASDSAWGTYNHNGHGTQMAGTSLYGDLHAALESTSAVTLHCRLESVKIVPPHGSNSENLYGHVMAQGLATAEIHSPNRKRIVVMAVTCADTRIGGAPTSWSGQADQLAAGVGGGGKRLVIVSAGNIGDPEEWKGYPATNVTNQIHDPAQAWNVLTVGAFTDKTRIDDPMFRHHNPIAPAGALSPYSTTSCAWTSGKWPIKPEVVFEGGNVSASAEGVVFDPDDLKMISTYYNPSESHFAPFQATSAASAQAAHFAASIQYIYPELWPETVRALIVHSARWTAAMQATIGGTSGKTAHMPLLRSCGYGVPNLARALNCATNRLTLVKEATMQPYKRKGSVYATNEMHVYDLPWPVDELASLGSVNVKMRVTLSYFIEPGPGELGWQQRYRYPSHGLRFDLNSPGESREELLKRLNWSAPGEELAFTTSAPSRHWMLGQMRDVGSIHSDVWSGTAAELATSNLLVVYPTIGWWRERHSLGRGNSKARYSLVVSIETPLESVDIYTPVATRLEVPIEIT